MYRCVQCVHAHCDTGVTEMINGPAGRSTDSEQGSSSTSHGPQANGRSRKRRKRSDGILGSGGGGGDG